MIQVRVGVSIGSEEVARAIVSLPPVKLGALTDEQLGNMLRQALLKAAPGLTPVDVPKLRELFAPQVA